MIEVILPNGETITAHKGITGYELLKSNNLINERIMAVSINDYVQELGDAINCSGRVEIYDYAMGLGNKIYVKGLSYVFALAIKDLFGYHCNYRIQTSVNHGLYVWFEEDMVNQENITLILNKMRETVNGDYRFEKVTVDRLESIKYFKQINRPEKVKLLRYNTKTFISLYKLKDQYDYYYGKLPFSTSFLSDFDIKFIDNKGLLLRFPTVFHNGIIPEFTDQANLFAAYREFSDWCNNQGIIYTSDLNEYVTFKDINDLIRIEEGRHNNELFNICNDIKASNKDIRMVLIAGPTSSGKTTTSKKLTTYLRGMGFDVKTVSVDDYFKERVDTPKDSAGQYDYESLAAIDVELFNNHLTSLFNGQEVTLPSYNFLTGIKEYKDKKMKLASNSVLIIEGLHALNDELTKSVESNKKYKIYISPLVQLNLDKNNPISSSDVRLLRRIVRDRKYRGSSVASTLNVWPKVRAAEDKYIYKYQADADKILNTSLIYEIGVLKTLAEAYLYEVNEEQKEYEQVKMLLNFLRNFLPIPTEEIPKDSLLREFIGGSCYE